jgi:hypothetical protein
MIPLESQIKIERLKGSIQGLLGAKEEFRKGDLSKIRGPKSPNNPNKIEITIDTQIESAS